MPNKIDTFRGEWAIFSNFATSVVQLDGVWYPTVENAYQAAKTRDLNRRCDFTRCTPGAAKRLGRAIQLRPDWEDIKVDVMWNLLVQKFAPKTGFAYTLLETGDAELVEGNTWGDTYWGVCNGEGMNMLGVLLMQRRAELQMEVSNER